MQKLQILFPEPQMSRLRAAAKREDRPISDIVRRATDAWLDKLSENYEKGREIDVPTFHGGRTLVAPENLRDLIYEEHLQHKLSRG